MATSRSSDTETKSSWLMKTFSSKSSRPSTSDVDETNSIVNPGFVSFGDILQPNVTTVQSPKQRKTTMDDPIVDIAVNAGSDISSLADKSKGTIDFFHTPPVSEVSCFSIEEKEHLGIGNNKSSKTNAL